MALAFAGEASPVPLTTSPLLASSSQISPASLCRAPISSSDMAATAAVFW